jgi:cytochrome c oxidase accessory protein FixG
MNTEDELQSVTERQNMATDPYVPETNATIGEHGKRQWLYPGLAKGRFTRARNIVSSGLILLYLAVPWLTIGGRPLLRFDIPGRRYHILGATFVATDLYLLALFLLMALIAMFLFSALLGRLWCGWGCPQTVYMEGVYRRIERWIEGPPLKRQKLDSGPHDDAYWARKVTKHGLFIVISLLLALSFIAYFIDPRASFAMLANIGSEHPAAFVMMLVTTGFVYFDFAWFREQFCTFLCPYARLQAVMLDEHSLIIAYDPQRGEPRGALRPGQSFEGRGDCVACKRCVQVCPTGIDIRQGLQLECISCTACIDACDVVMDKIGRPRGLIRYDSLAGIARKHRRILRPRVALYSLVLLVILTVFTMRLSGRETLELSVTRMAGIPYLVQDDGKVRNVFTLHVTNTEDETRQVSVAVSGAEDFDLIVPGQPFMVEPGARITAEAFVLQPRNQITAAETPIAFALVSGEQTVSTARAVFLGPVYHHDEHEHNQDQHEEVDSK